MAGSCPYVIFAFTLQLSDIVSYPVSFVMFLQAKRCDSQPRINQALNEQGDCLETLISIIGGVAIDTLTERRNKTGLN